MVNESKAEKESEVDYVTLDTHVIAAAKTSPWVEEWTAYIGAVAGINHSKEYVQVLMNGTKLPKRIAEMLFPQFAEKYYWRE